MYVKKLRTEVPAKIYIYVKNPPVISWTLTLPSFLI